VEGTARSGERVEIRLIAKKFTQMATEYRGSESEEEEAELSKLAVST